MKVPLMLISPENAKKIPMHLVGLGKIAKKMNPGLKGELERADLDVREERYAIAAMLSGLIWGLLFAILFFVLLSMRGEPIMNTFILSLIPGFGLGFLFFIVGLYYPKITEGKIAEKIDRDLIFALKDMRVQIGSGVSLYNALDSVGKGEYGQVSKEFRETVQKISAGETESRALEEMAISTDSEFLKKAVWQMVNALHSGSSLEKALESIIHNLTMHHERKIKEYSAELNFWILMYMVFAAAVPTMGITLLVVLSAFGGIGVNATTFIMIVIFAIITQIALIGLIKSRRPVIYV